MERSRKLFYPAVILAIFILLAIPYPSFAGPDRCGCYCGKITLPPCSDEKCKKVCGWRGPSGSSSSPSYDEEAERLRRLEEERKRLEAERQRQQEIGEQLRREEAAAKRRQENFDRQKQGVLGSMKDIGEGDLGMKGADAGGLGLKDIGDSASGLQEGGEAGSGLKDAVETKAPPLLDSPVVDLGDKKMEGNKQQFIGNKAMEEARSNLESTKQGDSGAVFDNKGKRAPGSSEPGVFVPGTGATEMSERARKDPRMIAAQKELADLRTKRQKLDEERTQLAKERNSTSDPVKLQQLTKDLDKAEKEYQGNLQAFSTKTEAIEKLKRTIDTEVEDSPQESKGGAK